MGKRMGRKDRRGTALVTMMLMVVVMAGASVMVLSTGLSGQREQRQERERLHARYICQAGIGAAMFSLQNGGNGTIGTAQDPTEWGNSQYYVTRTDLGPDVIRLEGIGLDASGGARQELILRQTEDTIWQYGAFGDEFLHMDSNAHVDSYDSEEGSYDSQATGSGSDEHANSNGNVGSNGDITMDSNSLVWGNAASGPGQTTTITGNAEVTGSTTPMEEPMEMPLLDVPMGYANFGSLTVNSNITIPASNRKYNNITVTGNDTLTINGPANIVVTNLIMNANSTLKVNATGGIVTIWVLDDFVMNSNAFIGPTDFKPKNLLLNLLSDNVINPEVAITLDDVDFDSNSKLYGMVYAPSAAIEVNSNFELFGSMIARSIDLDSNAFFHFDEALVDATASGTPTFETICWRELPYLD